MQEKKNCWMAFVFFSILYCSTTRRDSRGSGENPNQIKEEYPSASILNDNRVIFNIKGNSYRLVVKISYEYQMVWIRFIGTHAEYDKINSNTI